jgi:hypothetical protein
MAYFRCSTGSASSGDGVALVVECDVNFAGSTITADNGEDIFTETCPSVSPYTVRFEGIPTGTYTISGVSQGQTFTTQFTVLDYETTLNATPEGATVLPINDIQTWLHCANIWDKNYTTIDEVLADTSTLQALMASNNAADYMARFTNAYNQIVPTMTSDTTPSGQVIYSGSYSGQPGWQAFDNNDTTTWSNNNNTYNGAFIGYKFPSAKKIYAMIFTKRNFSVSDNGFCTAKVQASNDNSAWVDLTSELSFEQLVNGQTGEKLYFPFTKNIGNYTYYRLFYMTGSGIGGLYPTTAGIGLSSAPNFISALICNQNAMSYIGANNYCADKILTSSAWTEAICSSLYMESVLNAKVPTMTSDTTPSGETFANIEGPYGSWKAFNGTNNDASDCWFPGSFTANVTNIGYDFQNLVCVKKVFMENNVGRNNTCLKDFILQGYNGTWKNLGSYVMDNGYVSKEFISNNVTKYSKYRILISSAYTSNGVAIGRLQFWGRKNV